MGRKERGCCQSSLLPSSSIFLLLRPPPAGIVPVILLDSYRCHLMGLVVRAIQELGVEVIHIPGGCTGLLQPLDVGLNKPFKVRVRASWEEWMMAMIDNHGVVKSPTRDSAHWGRWHFSWRLVRCLQVRTAINGTSSIWTKCHFGFRTTAQRLFRRGAQKQ